SVTLSNNSHSFNNAAARRYLKSCPMPQDPLSIEDLAGPQEGQRVLRLTGPLLINNLFDFQGKVRADQSRELILDFTGVPYIDSAGIGALVGAYVNHSKDKRSLVLIGVTERVLNSLKVTKVEQFFSLYKTLEDVGQAVA